MRPSSSPSSIPPSSVSFFERYEKMFHCGGCIAADDEPVAEIYQKSSYEDEQQSKNFNTEAISNCSSYKRARKQHESPPVVTMMYNQASFDEVYKFDIDEQKSKRQSKSKTAKAKAQTTEAAANEYFNRIKQKLPTINNNNSNQQKQYQCNSGSHYRNNSISAAEELLSHYYNQNEDVASFYAFR